MKTSLSTLTACAWLLASQLLNAQPPAVRVANPETVEFDILENEGLAIDNYRLELFHAGSDTSTAEAIRTFDVQPSTLAREGKLARIDLTKLLSGFADGEYVATIRVLSADGESPRSNPTPPFVVSGRSAPAQAQVSPPLPAANLEHNERFWTKVAVIIGAAVLLLPIVLR